MATSNGKRSNKIGRSSLSFFSFSALRFLVYCFCFAFLLLSFFFFYQIDLLIQNSVRGIFTSKHLAEYNCSVAKSN